jgi:hypothetical protein
MHFSFLYRLLCISIHSTVTKYIAYGMGLLQLMGGIHLGIILLIAVFFLIPKTRFDFLFLTWNYCAFLSWAILSGDCLLTWMVRGRSDTAELDDVYSLFKPEHVPYAKTGMKVVLVFHVVSMWVVAQRNKLNPLLLLLPVALYYHLYALHNSTIDRVFMCIFPIYIVYFVMRFFGKRFG